ncbi:NTP/NDP exchange transporter [Tatumella citrea]|uniref:MFS transporter n=1 Tax=Tatumella citrea TaxID=53336 RepID=A0A1Y0LJG6_TATCI|nr:MFS transporter [Tatumella citrea]ARU93751.1 MFS transporter [Tatumella citrea]ARU97789.1 MFS transporter [Tatumella citrea]
MENTNDQRPESEQKVSFLKFLNIRPEEWRPLLWCIAYIFFLLCAYYILRPVRDTLGIEGGVHNLQWLFTATLICMLVLNLPFSALSQSIPRQRLIPITYRFFLSNLLIFAGLMAWLPSGERVWVGRVFFVWVSVFNLYVVSVFWVLVADIFSTERARRLFALMAAGATAGAIGGSLLTTVFARLLNTTGLILFSAILLECAVFCVGRLIRHSAGLSGFSESHSTHEVEEDKPLGGSVFSGITHTFRSAYLRNICLYMLLFSVTSTLLYFRQAELVRHAFSSEDSRTTFFATTDLAVNILTLITQVFITSRLLNRYGIALVLCFLPVLTIAGFMALSVWPALWTVMLFSILRRAGNFALARPAREVLFTVLQREDKYKAKSFIDTAVYRAGDQVGAWSWAAMGAVGLAAGMLAWVAVPLSVIWWINSVWLGRRQRFMREFNQSAIESKKS